MISRVIVSSAGIPPRGRQRAQRYLIAASFLSLLAFSSVASAIDIAEGQNIFTFDDPPVVADWTTRSLAGGGNTWLNLAALNSAVQAVTASSITTALPTDTAADPGTNANARWNSNRFALQTRPTGNAGTLLLGKFNNVTDNFISDFLISYDVGKYTEAATELLGHYVYYSTTGAANSWIPFDNGNGTNEFGSAGGAQFLFTSTSLGETWGNNPLYILWADDNGDGVGDTGYTIDNLQFEAVLGGPKDPPPPPTPVFGDITPDQLQDFETVGAGLPLNNGGIGTVAAVAGSQALQVIGTPLDAMTDQVDLRGIDDATHTKVVGVDLKAWEASTGTDFETGDQIAAFAEWSSDGLTFTSIPIVDLHGIDRSTTTDPPYNDAVPDPADQIRQVFGPTSEQNNANEPWKHFELTLPAAAETVRVRVVLNVNSTSTTTGEFAAVDNIVVAAVPIIVPEPATLAMFGFAAISLVGYGICRRKA